MNEFGDGAIEFGGNRAVSTNALPLSLIVAKVLPMMKTPSDGAAPDHAADGNHQSDCEIH